MICVAGGLYLTGAWKVSFPGSVTVYELRLDGAMSAAAGLSRNWAMAMAMAIANPKSGIQQIGCVEISLLSLALPQPSCRNWATDGDDKGAVEAEGKDMASLHNGEVEESDSQTRTKPALARSSRSVESTKEVYGGDPSSIRWLWRGSGKRV